MLVFCCIPDIMAQDLNSCFLDRCHNMVSKQGTFGHVKIYRDKTDRIVVRKSAWRNQNCDYFSNMTNALYLCKEFLITRYLSGKGAVPEVTDHSLDTLKVERQNMTVVRDMVTEFAGPTLDLCSSVGFLLEPKTMLLQLLQACAHLHHLNVLHLDLKPNNVTFDLNSRKIKLIDMGLAELTGFHDLETEGGLKKWQQTPGFLGNPHFGEVTEGGLLSSMAPPGMPYLQSKFVRPFLGKTRLANRVNVPGYAEPLSKIAELLGTTKGLVVDDKSDIYSIGMIVLSHLNACNVRVLWDSTKTPEQVLIQWLNIIVSMRGSCSDVEFWEIKKTIADMIRVGGIASNVPTIQRDALLYAIHHSLVGKGGPQGLKQDLASILGNDVTTVLLSMINPCPKFRPKACEAIDVLIKEKPMHLTQSHNKHTRIEHHVEVANGNFLVGRMSRNGLRVASIAVDLNGDYLMWSKGIEYFRNMPVNERERGIDTMIKSMHAWRGQKTCKDSWRWFRQLKVSHLLFNDLYI